MSSGNSDTYVMDSADLQSTCKSSVENVYANGSLIEESENDTKHNRMHSTSPALSGIADSEEPTLQSSQFANLETELKYKGVKEGKESYSKELQGNPRPLSQTGGALEDDLPSGNLIRQRSLRGTSFRALKSGPQSISLRKGNRSKSLRHAAHSDTVQANSDDVVISAETALQLEGEQEVQEEEEEDVSVPDKLQDRLAVQRNNDTKMHLASYSLREEFIHTKWPKIKRRLFSWRAFELWSSHLKYISGHYGSGVYSYYNFLRWLFLLNILLGLILTTFIVLPQFFFRARPEGEADRARMLEAVHNCYRASVDVDPNVTAAGTTIFRCDGGCMPVYDACEAAPRNSTVNVTECRFSNPPGSALLEVTTDPVCRNNSATTQRCLCPRQVGFIQGVSDFLNGEGIFSTSELFIGWYTDTLIVGYDLPVVYLLVWGFVYALSLLLIAHRIGSSFKEHFIFNNRLVAKSRRNACNRVFAGWDFNISDKLSALRQHHSTKRRLEELAGELAAVKEKRRPKDVIKTIVIRIATNTFIILSLMGGGVAIYFAVDAELRLINTSLLSAAVISLVNYILPNIYSYLANAEDYESPRTSVLITTLRFLVVRLFSYITLLLSVVVQIDCTQPDPSGKGMECLLDFASDFRQFSMGRGGDSCPSCWETVIGQKFYTNAVVNIFVSVISTIGLDILANVTSRIKWPPAIGKYFTREFDVPGSVIDLVEVQIIFWLGSFFCPMISIILVLHLLIQFYVKRFSMQLNMEPSKDLYLAAKRDVGFLFILLFTGLVCIIPVTYSITRLVPSSSCGPFRRSSFIYSVIEERIELLDCDTQAIIGFVISSSFLLFLIMILVLACIGFLMTLNARNKHVDLLLNQYKSESADKTHLTEMAEVARQQLFMYQQLEEMDTAFEGESDDQMILVHKDKDCKSDVIMATPLPQEYSYNAFLMNFNSQDIDQTDGMQQVNVVVPPQEASPTLQNQSSPADVPQSRRESFIASSPLPEIRRTSVTSNGKKTPQPDTLDRRKESLSQSLLQGSGKGSTSLQPPTLVPRKSAAKVHERRESSVMDGLNTMDRISASKLRKMSAMNTSSIDQESRYSPRRARIGPTVSTLDLPEDSEKPENILPTGNNIQESQA